ncbi:MAG: hypothetical protein ACR2QC_10635 [Gammaproteobacteria bacterium]
MNADGGAGVVPFFVRFMAGVSAALAEEFMELFASLLVFVFTAKFISGNSET